MLFGYSKIIVPLVIYGLMFVSVYFAFSKNKEYALYFTLPLICLPNIRMKLEPYPFGKDYIDIVFLCIFLSLVMKGQFSLNIKNGIPIIVYILMLSFSFFVIGGRMDGDIPHKELADYKNYIMMPLTYFIVYNGVQRLDLLKVFIPVFSITFLAMNRTTYGEYGLGEHTNFVSEQRPGGVFEAEGLGSNHLGAFMAEYTMILIGVAAYIGRKLVFRSINFVYILWFAIVGNIYSLLFSFSRGAWFGTLAGLAFLGVFKMRKLLVLLLALGIFWQVLLPTSVIQRIEMTEQSDGVTQQLDSSSMHRVEIWQHSMDLFEQSPIVGVGLYNFQFFDGRQLWLSTHNQYLAYLSETGIIGFLLFLFLFALAILSGWRLYRNSVDPLLRGLGIGFSACVIAAMVSNIFGDRWTFMSLQGLYWVFWALVEKGSVLEAEKKAHG